MKKYFVFILIAVLCSCRPKSIEKDGGMVINISLCDKNASDGDIRSTMQILQKRIERFCLDNPKITLSQDKKNIQIILPLANDSALYKDILKRGCFAITETYDNHLIYQCLAQVDNKLKQTHGLNSFMHRDSAVVGQSPETNSFFKILYPPVSNDGQMVSNPIVGFARYQDTTLINTILNNKDYRSCLPQDCYCKWSKTKSEDYWSLIALKRATELNILPDMITETAVYAGKNGDFEVSFVLKPEYIQLWADLTRKNIGKFVAIVVDAEVFAKPLINSEIKTGSSQISCSMNKHQAQALATILKFGATPLNFKIKTIEMIQGQ